MRLYSVTTAPGPKAFCAGVVVDERTRVITETAPILHRYKGWSIGKFATYCKQQGWDLYRHPERSIP